MNNCCCTVSTSNAGLNQTLNGVSETFLSANKPSIGCGKWTLVSGSGKIVNNKKHNTKVTNLGLGVNTFQWRISLDCKECCQDILNESIDTVNITVKTDYQLTTNLNSPIITSGIEDLDIIITFKELKGINSNILNNIYSTIPKNDSRITINFNPLLTTFLGENVDNSLFTFFSNPSTNYFIFNPAFPANGVYKVGFTLTYNPLGTSGFDSFGFQGITINPANDYINSNNSKIYVHNYSS